MTSWLSSSRKFWTGMSKVDLNVEIKLKKIFFKGLITLAILTPNI